MKHRKSKCHSTDDRTKSKLNIHPLASEIFDEIMSSLHVPLEIIFFYYLHNGNLENECRRNMNIEHWTYLYSIFYIQYIVRIHFDKITIVGYEYEYNEKRIHFANGHRQRQQCNIVVRLIGNHIEITSSSTYLHSILHYNCISCHPCHNDLLLVGVQINNLSNNNMYGLHSPLCTVLHNFQLKSISCFRKIVHCASFIHTFIHPYSLSYTHVTKYFMNPL